MKAASLALGVALLAQAALAGTEITVETRQADAAPDAKPRESRLAIEGRSLHAETTGGRHSLVYRGEGGVLEVYDHREKTVFRLDRATARSAARGVESAREAMEALPEPQRSALESALGMEREVDSVTLRETGRGDRVADVACRLLELRQGAVRRAEICEAPPGAAGVSAEALATVRELVAFASDVVDLLPAAVGAAGLAALAGAEKIDGVPLRVRAWPSDAPASETRIVRAVPRAYPPERFQPPPDYRPGLGIQIGPDAAR
ncbi:MAG: hypothetical protein ABFS41_15930 [Myxococcota bacterium]